MDQPPACSRIASTTRGWQCPTLDTEMPAEEVEVLVAVVVPEPRALAADEAHRVARVGRHQVVALVLLSLVALMPPP